MWSNQEIIFAQKATAIVKAAGMDPRTLDLEQFRLLAPMIFTRAYCAIYKENQFSLDSDSSKEEIILVSQLVIDGLVAKTRNPALSMITGFDVYQRNHRAIGILVGLLFDEGQRLWMEKRASFRDSAKTSNVPNDRSSVTSTALENRKDGDSPREIRKLLNKIDSLEGQLTRSKTRKEPKPQVVPDQSEQSISSSHHNGGSTGNNENNKGDATSTRSSSPKPKKRPTSASALSSFRNPTASSSNSTRPSSAGTSRVVRQLREHQKNQEDLFPLPMPPTDPPKSPDQKRVKSAPSTVQYTYDMKSGRKIPLKSANEIYNQEQIVNNLDQLQFNQNKQAIKDSLYPDSNNRGNPKTNLPLRPEYPGKRIEKSVEEWLKKVQELNKYAADPTYHSTFLENYGIHSLPAATQTNTVVYHPIYPSLEDYDVILSIEHCHTCSHHNISLRHDPKEYLDKAQKLIKQLALSLFESHYCIRLGISLIPADLSCKTDQTRVGAFEVQIAYKSPVTLELEVDVLYSKLQTRRWPSKSVIERRLESFLIKHNIPRAKTSATESEDYELVHRNEFNSYPKGSCGSEAISISNFNWNYSFAASNLFTEILYDFRSLLPKDYRPQRLSTTTGYRQPPPPSSASHHNHQSPDRSSPRINNVSHNNSNNSNNASPSTKREEKSHRSVKIPSVPSSPRKEESAPDISFQIGQRVFVANISYDSDRLEPYSLPGVIKRLPPLLEEAVIITPRAKNQRKYRVLAQYFNEEIEVSEASLALEDPNQAWISSRETILLGHNLPLPVEFEEFFVLLSQLQLTHLWKFPETGDQINVISQEVEYSRKTVFQTIRSMVWQCHLTVTSNGSDNSNSTTVTRLHRLYSDYLLDWIFLSSNNSSMTPKEFVSQSYLLNLQNRSSFSVNSAIESTGIQEEKEEVVDKTHREGENTPSPIKDKEELEAAKTDLLPPPASSSSPRPSEDNVPPITSETTEEKQTLSSDNNNPTTTITTSSDEQKVDPSTSTTQSVPNPETKSDPDKRDDEFEDAELVLASEGPPTTTTTTTTNNNTNSVPPVKTTSPRDFEDKDIIISSIVLEGSVLTHEFYDTVFVTFSFQTFMKEAKVCLAREKGSKRRSFNVNWEEIPMTALAFKENALDRNKSSVFLVLAISDQTLVDSQPQLNLPVLERTERGKSPNSCQIPLSEFYKDSFEIKCEVTLPPIPGSPIPASSSSNNNNNSNSSNSTIVPQDHPGKVTITITGHAHEAKESRRSRILSMRPVELLKLKFEPLPVDDEYSDDEDPTHHSLEESDPSEKKHSSRNVSVVVEKPRKTVVNQPVIEEGEDENDTALNAESKDLIESQDVFKTSPQQITKETGISKDYENDELQKTLFPKPSLHNLLSKE